MIRTLLEFPTYNVMNFQDAICHLFNTMVECSSEDDWSCYEPFLHAMCDLENPCVITGSDGETMQVYTDCTNNEIE